MHTAVSGGIGVGVWVATGTPLAVPAALATGVFTDSDHVLDFFTPRDGRVSRHMLRPFHAWEYAIVGLVVLFSLWYHPLFLAATLGYLSHLFIDQFGNKSHPMAYFISYRALRRFRRIHLTPHLYGPSHRMLPGPVPLWGRLEPQLYKLYLRIRTGKRW